ncbi:uncharacterized protein LOC126900724 [Daktulosphaira vitifoliae]|uniref:uncharacterized protein LOC126900724 n=1 Tax=Daktulosphaira vitifoliae TaxID=58002 RepID=UPI0021AA7C9D|nr:uncharacterized protein LOC126900724 [Daktulosphaira vitifoliae]XP_050532602.1 uncharacterized protein LOC126900724 [Daktulosphaira vitifoliae]
MICSKFIYVLIFLMPIYVKYFTEAKKAAKSVILRHLFKNDGWKNLNDVSQVTILGCNYHLNDISEKDIDSSNADKRVRIATIFLAASHGNVLKKLFYIVDKFREHCDDLLEHDYIKLYNIFNNIDEHDKINCINKLLNTIQNILLLAKKMEGAIDAIDDMHSNSLKTSIRYKEKYILKNMFNELQNFDDKLQSKEPNKTTLSFIKTFFSGRIREIIKSTRSFASLIFEDRELFMDSIMKEYKENPSEDTDGHKLSVHLITKINEIIEHTVQKKIFELGFKYNVITGEVYITTSCEDIENESKRNSEE